MTFILNLIAVVYLFAQRYFHHNLLGNIFLLNNFADFFYIAEILVLTFFYFAEKGNKPFAIKLLSVLNIILIILSETFRNFNMFPSSFLFGYPSGKIIVAGIFSLLFFNILFIIFVLANRFLKKRMPLLTSLYELIFVIFFFVAYSFYLNVNFKPGNPNDKTKYDYVVVLGAAVKGDKPYPILKGRINKAKEILNRNFSEKILLTGGAAPGEPSEARVSRNFLIQNGIPPSKILFEEKTTTTLEQIGFLKKLQEKTNSSFIVVSDKFHLRRVNEIAEFLGCEITTTSSDTKLSVKKEIYYNLRDSIAFLLFLFFAI